jgi:hypothetical protein
MQTRTQKYLLPFTVMRTMLALSVFAIFMVSAVQAQTITTPTLGRGISTDPYQISTLGHLVFLANAATLTSGTWNNDTTPVYYKMTKNIDASATAKWTDNGTTTTKVGFMPIGADTNVFYGNFDGNGHSITGLTINRPAMECVGLFGTVYGGAIKNLTLKNATVTGNSAAGGLAGMVGSATISNCSVSGKITTVSSSSAGAGGLVGHVGGTMAPADITKCSASATVTGAGYNSGGLVGYMYGTITNSSASGQVIGAGGYAGGLVGYAYRSTLASSSASGKVTGAGENTGGLVGYTYRAEITDQCSAKGAVSGGEYVGGLVGLSESTEISDASASGKVIATSNFAGGLVGQALAGGTISNCVAKGAINGTGSNVGGLVGYMYLNDSADTTLTISGSSASGAVTGGGQYVGGLVGHAELYCTVSSNMIITISDSSASGAVTGSDNHVGGLVGYAGLYHSGTGSGNAMTISGCSASGAVSGKSYAGGLAGYVYVLAPPDSPQVISECFATGAVRGTNYLGGLVGDLDQGTDDVTQTLSGSFAKGAVTGTGDSLGGLVGRTGEWSGTRISNCCASGAVSSSSSNANDIGGLVGWNYAANVTDCNASGSVSGYARIGGLIGRNNSTVQRCYAAGAVTSRSDTNGDGAGGLVGVNESSVTDCYALGNVKMTQTSPGGGLVGRNTRTVTRCYSVGKPTGTNIGGLIGDIATGTVTKSFWNAQTSKIADANLLDDVIGTTTLGMKTTATFTDAGWDFNTVWGRESKLNNGYPYLSAESAPLNAVAFVLSNFTINSGDLTTSNRTVSLNYDCSCAPGSYMVSESASFKGAAWQDCHDTTKFTLSATNGKKTVYLKVKNAAGKTSAAAKATITLMGIPVVKMFKINDGAASITTGTLSVTLTNTYIYTGTDTLEYMASESENFTGGTWKAYAAAPSFDLKTTNTVGTKTIYFKLRTTTNLGESAVKSDTIKMIAGTSAGKKVSTTSATTTVAKTAVATSSSKKTTTKAISASAGTSGATTTTDKVTSATADLRVKDYTLTETEDGFIATLIVTNVGKAASGAFPVALYRWTDATTDWTDAVLEQAVTVEGLAAGEEITVPLECNLSDLDATEGAVCPVVMVGGKVGLVISQDREF